MSISATSPRFINTPTVLEEYEADQQAYSAVIAGDAPLRLSREHDLVDGNETLYRALLTRFPIQTPVEGNEGFLSSIKAGVSALIKAVRDFFKWLWEFFTGRQARLENKTENLEHDLKERGVKSSDINYPLSVFDLYPKTTRPETSLLWLEAEIGAIGKAITKVESYLDVTRAFSQAAVSGTVKGTDLDSYLKTVKEAFVEGHAFFGPHTLKVSQDGRITTVKLPRDSRNAPGIFRTSLTQVQHLLDEVKGLQNKLDTMLTKSVALEQGLLKALGKVQEPPQLEAVKLHVRTSMGSIKELETALFRGTGAALNILKAAVND